MIQEILDYLLIKAQFILCSEEELLEKVKDERMLEIYCDNICRILEEDNFFFTSDELINKLKTIVHLKRFDGTHKKELIYDFNTMIGAINQYYNLSNAAKMTNTAKWINKEAEKRNLPFRKIPGYDLSTIYNCIKNESYYAKILLQENCDLEIYDPFYLLTTINLFCNCYPEILLENMNAVSRCCASVVIIEDVCKGHYFSTRMVKQTYKLLEKVTGKIPDEEIDDYQKVIKKTEN